MRVVCCRQRAQGARVRNAETKRPGTRDRAVRPGGAPEANAELAASLAYVCPSNEIVSKGVWCTVCILGFCFSNFGL